MANAPEGTKTLKPIGKGLEGLQYSLQISALDCTGCEVCVNQCPAPKGKALVMTPIEDALKMPKKLRP
jgi:pyruvate-ferredoxin/flavodoxin oxidoreductase